MTSMDDFEIVVWDAPSMESELAWSGESTYATKHEETTYRAKFSTEPLIAYCPHCSIH